MDLKEITLSQTGVQIEEGWKAVLKDEFEKPYFTQIKSFIVEQRQQGKTVYPPGEFIFNAFNLTPFEQVKVVLLGQDPYHGPGQAHGLCFSVQDGVRFPPSLMNIFKELKSDLDIDIPKTGNLTNWAKQGVLLLNSVLTVNAREAASHKSAGWQTFTDTVISKLSDQKVGLVFILWGRFAQEKSELIDEEKHYVLRAPHPSPFSADRGFFGCKHFSKANEKLKHEGFNPIDWTLT